MYDVARLSVVLSVQLFGLGSPYTDVMNSFAMYISMSGRTVPGLICSAFIS